MITRAQAEALLTLAESLEACHQLGVTVSEEYDGVRVEAFPTREVIEWSQGAELTGMSLRLLVDKMIPKQETYTLNWEEKP